MRTLKKICILPGMLVVFINSFSAGEKDQWDPFIGIWEYRQENSAAESGFDPEGERIEFRRHDGGVVGWYFGVEREGEHGLFYSAAEVTELTVEADGTVHFIVPARRIFDERPNSIKEAGENGDAGNGFTQYPLKYTGSIVNGVLILHCTSEHGNCPDEQLNFYKGRWK